MTVAATPTAADLKQSGPEIRQIEYYNSFWEMNSQTNTEEEEDGNVLH